MDPVFNLRFFEKVGGGVVLYNMGYQMIELIIPLQTRFYEDQKEVGVRTSFFT